MKNEICTSPYQSMILKEAGINTYTADMLYSLDDDEIYIRHEFTRIDRFHLPIWSLGALLNILHNYTLQTTTDGKVFAVCDKNKPVISDVYDSPIDACVNTIIRLKEMKLI